MSVSVTCAGTIRKPGVGVVIRSLFLPVYEYIACEPSTRCSSKLDTDSANIGAPRRFHRLFIEKTMDPITPAAPSTDSTLAVAMIAESTRICSANDPSIKFCVTNPFSLYLYHVLAAARSS